MHCLKLLYNSAIVLRQIRSTNLNVKCEILSEMWKIARKYSCDETQQNFKGNVDIFNGVTIDLSQQLSNLEVFRNNLNSSLTKWQTEGRRCIWFKVDIKNSSCIPILAEQGFNYHHARRGFVMMYKWLPTDSVANLPPSSHTNLGVGAMVFNSKNQILAISDKYYDYPHWKLPGGYIEQGEDIITAAMREVQEETGVLSKFESLVTFRHTHHMMYGNSDVYIILRMSSVCDEIIKSSNEIKDCKWMNVDEYVNHPNVHQWNRSIVINALKHKKKGLKLDIQKKTVQWAKNTREMNFLTINHL